MTLQEIRDSVRNLIHDYPSEAQAKLDATNYLLDYYINLACGFVVTDLAKVNPESFILTEDITLTLTTGGLKTVAINDAGTGYTPGDQVLTVAVGTGGKLHVTASAGGLVTSINAIIGVGSGYSVSTAVATTGGGGTGAKINITAVTPASPAVILSASWIQIWQILKKSDLTPIPYVPWSPELMTRSIALAAAAAPAWWTLSGKIVYFFPIITGTLSSYATVYYIAPEANPMATTGPTLIPAIAQNLIPLMAAIYIGVMAKQDNTKYLELYALTLSKISPLLTIPVIGQRKNLTQVTEAEVPIQKADY